jgi:hypothetical protein
MERNRRSMIGVACICASILVGAIVMGGVADASNGDPILLGFGNNASSGTSVNTTNGVGLLVISNDPSNSAVGLMGEGSTGVLGESGTGTGVRGTTTDNTDSGVVGINSASTNSGGSGVVGIAHNNIGVSAISSNGTALAVSGVAFFSRSGRATVPIGSKKVVVSVPLGNSSMVLATVQQKGRAAVASAIPNPSADTFTISLTRKAIRAVVVAWFVLG